MKIGVMTFHKSESHGAMLQAFALQTTLEKLGNEVEIINYDRFFLKNEKKVSAGTLRTKIKSLAIRLSVISYNLKYKRKISAKKERFESFRSDYLKIGTKEYHTSEELKKDPPEYDAYVTGSDQVWNPDSINHDAYYFTFLDYSAKTIAYAPSIGVSKLDDNIIRDKMKGYLQHVQFLSCREKTGATIIESIANRHVEQVLDPTLLLTKEEWSSLILKKTKRKPYVLCYFLGSLKYGREYAKTIAKKMGYDIVIISQSPVEIFSRHKKELDVGPLEFLELFEGASVICTDSFHGTAFSIIFQKQFYSFCRRNPNGTASRISRLRDVLEKLKLSQRLIMPGDTFTETDLNIDYCEPMKILNAERERSINYLVQSLNCE
ncbi:MAG: polysaccharide pyruvyl transferase family protein [Christensenellaceae bacterium]